jgi:hypothetical protein
LPVEPLHQLVKLDFERSAEFGEGVDPGNPKTALKLTYLRAVNRGTESDLILRKVSAPAATNEVVAEGRRHIDV